MIEMIIGAVIMLVGVAFGSALQSRAIQDILNYDDDKEGN